MSNSCIFGIKSELFNINNLRVVFLTVRYVLFSLLSFFLGGGSGLVPLLPAPPHIFHQFCPKVQNKASRWSGSFFSWYCILHQSAFCHARVFASKGQKRPSNLLPIESGDSHGASWCRHTGNIVPLSGLRVPALHCVEIAPTIMTAYSIHGALQHSNTCT